MPSSQERTQLKTVTGFIVELPSKKSDESDDDEDDDDDERNGSHAARTWELES